MTKIILQAIATLIFGTILLGVLVFVPAGTLDYWQAWVFIAVFMVTLTIFGLYFAITDPALMERRLQAGPGAERSTLQKIVATIAFSMLALAFVLPGLDRRFGWSHMPPAVSWLGDALEVLAFAGFTWVQRVNSFGGASIRVEEKQPVVSTGPYAIVRHPMYLVTFLMVIGIALGLGSWWTLLLLVIQVIVLPIRILDEERLLENDLPGYRAYEQKVLYRLVRHIW